MKKQSCLTMKGIQMETNLEHSDYIILIQKQNYV